MVVYIIIVLILIAFKFWWDLRQQKKGIVIDHTLSAFIDVVLYFSTALVIQVIQLNKVSCWYATEWLLVGLYLRWLITDISHSIYTLDWKHWYYLGEYSAMDRFGRKIGEKLYLAIRLLIFAYYIAFRITFL